MNSTYAGVQYDHIEKALDDAEKLIMNPKTRIEGDALARITKLRIEREKSRMAYAALTKQKPYLPHLEPSNEKLLKG